MGVNTYNLQAIKKELQHLSGPQMADLCLRLAKYKKENKELLSYLMFEADNDTVYTENVKQEVDGMFGSLLKHSYYAAKGLRKILKLINKHVKFMASKPAEIELLIHYCRNYIQHVDLRTGYKPLRQLLIKQLEKTSKLIGALHEDLQFDHRHEFESVVQQADEKISWIDKRDFV
ncbi:hypothetical protein [Mucilaginibacter lacusdianchii]|uniref:hypothetical protein n=1 Tax=Mucilaginibacter lacusdianchii TaxID=2684211 RepID=UPI00131B1C1A|nr:hypothetical protein [Mucilaginibacter sp. JXJ CY 39]